MVGDQPVREDSRKRSTNEDEKGKFTTKSSQLRITKRRDVNILVGDVALQVNS